jgi:predicted RNase H-like nuclease
MLGTVTEVLGVDAYRYGWAAVRLVHGEFAGVFVHPDFSELLRVHPAASVIAVDIPIGFPDHKEPRQADVAARMFVGRAAGSVFPVPPREVLECLTHAEANAMSRELTGKGLSAQSYALRHRILEVDGLVDGRVVEVHPEASFAALAGEHLGFSKKTWNGLMLRVTLLASVGIILPMDLGPTGVPAPDDIVDAAVAAWTARRLAAGKAIPLPAHPPVDERGRQVAIWY